MCSRTSVPSGSKDVVITRFALLMQLLHLASAPYRNTQQCSAYTECRQGGGKFGVWKKRGGGGGRMGGRSSIV